MQKRRPFCLHLVLKGWRLIRSTPEKGWLVSSDSHEKSGFEVTYQWFGSIPGVPRESLPIRRR